MNFHNTDNEALSKVADLEIEDIPIEGSNDADVLDAMAMLPFSNIPVPIEEAQIYSDPNIAMEQMPMYDMLEVDYNSNYFYDYPLSTEMELDYNIYNFDDTEIGQIIDPWESMTGMSSQIGEMNCNNNLENINDYNFVNSRGNYDYSNPKAPSDTNELLASIETFNPVIIRRLLAYGVPYDTARRLIRRIISLTLDYYR
jgi:hypothetical protein